MKAGETLSEFDECFNCLVNELVALGKEHSNREIALKVMRALPREWDVKTMAIRLSKDLNKMELHDLFADLKAYEFELELRSGEEPSSNQPTKALAATATAPAVVAPSASPITTTESTSDRTAEQISNDAISLFVKKFSRFMKKNHRAYKNPNRDFKKESPSGDMACFNCGKIGHFIVDCPKPKRDDQKKEYKRNDKKSRRDRKDMIADENKSKWTDSSSESSDSDDHSSDSDAEEVKCLMADTESTSTSGEVFNFDSNEFTRTDLVNALHDMVEDCSDLKVEISKLKTENEKENTEYQTMRSENQKLSLLVNAWNKSSVSLEKMQELQKQSGDKSGLGFSNNESTSETSTNPILDMNKGKFIHFVKSSVVHEPVIPTVQVKKFVNKMDRRNHYGLGYVKLKSRFHQSARSSRGFNSGGLSSMKKHEKKAKISSSIWYLDSGCSRHMTRQKNFLTEVMSCNGPKITFGDNSKDAL
ncbi:uncharacterized protein [Primulina huaijiensis]|uniref:uncharacterized protein n=1 Tax=Primulina huaijiensis TaxID=1492673 RepID=UPI003CC79713